MPSQWRASQLALRHLGPVERMVGRDAGSPKTFGVRRRAFVRVSNTVALGDSFALEDGGLSDPAGPRQISGKTDPKTRRSRPAGRAHRWGSIASAMGDSDTGSGQFEFLQLIGLSDAEAAYAREHGSDVLLPRLREAGCAPVVDPHRAEMPL